MANGSVEAPSIVPTFEGATTAELDAAMPAGAPPVYDDTALFQEGAMLTNDSFLPDTPYVLTMNS
jgi:hypothetical protein